MENRHKTGGSRLSRRNSPNIINHTVQMKTDRLTMYAKSVEMKVSVGKSKLLTMNSKNKDTVKVNEQEIKDVDKSVYLLATVSKEGGETENIHNRRPMPLANELKSDYI